MKQSCGRRASVQPAEGESPRSASRKVIEELFEAIVAGATGPTVEMRHGPITALVSSWTGWSVRETDARLNFPIAAGELIERGLHAKADHVRARAGADLDQIIAAGLRHREGQLLVPVAVVKPELGLDAVTYEMLLEWRRKVHPSPGDGIPDAPCVCEGCTHIFRPRGRKTRARYCSLCAKRPPSKNVLGFPNQMASTDGWMDRPLRAPVLFGNAITGWRSVRIRRCRECGDPFICERATGRYCSPACRKRAARRVRESPSATPG